jgi:hypothetical protein
VSETWCQLHVSCSETKGQSGVLFPVDLLFLFGAGSPV